MSAIRGFLPAGLILCLVCVLIATSHPDPGPVSAASRDLKAQVRAALASARVAASATDVNDVWRHLGRVKNCLTGPKASSFNPNYGNVCQGNGIGVDLELVPVPVRYALEALARAAFELTQVGMGDKELASAKITARGVVALLGVIDEHVK